MPIAPPWAVAMAQMVRHRDRTRERCLSLLLGQWLWHKWYLVGSYGWFAVIIYGVGKYPDYFFKVQFIDFVKRIQKV